MKTTARQVAVIRAMARVLRVWETAVPEYQRETADDLAALARELAVLVPVVSYPALALAHARIVQRVDGIDLGPQVAALRDACARLL